MKTWYFRINGDEGGPVSQETVLTWIMEGRLPREGLLRAEDATDWEPAEKVFPDFFEPQEQAPTGRARGRSLVPTPPPEGTAGKTPTKELLGSAMAALRAQWPVVVVAHLLCAAVYAAVGQIHRHWAFPVTFFLMGPLDLGWAIFALVVSRGGKGRLRLLLAGFRDFRRALLAGFLRGLILFAWVLPCALIFGVPYAIVRAIFGAAAKWDNPAYAAFGYPTMVLAFIPFYIAMLRYALTMFLLAEDNGLTARQALRESKRVMVGRKVRLFRLLLPFVVIAVLFTALNVVLGRVIPPGPWRFWVITLVGTIGALLYAPTMALCIAKFFDDLHPLPLQTSAPTWALKAPKHLGP